MKRQYVTRKCDESITAARISNLMKNPANGGIPLLEKIRNAKKIARSGFIFLSDENWLSLIVLRFIIRRINHITNELRI
jgi:hypothetical protein